MSAQDRWRKNSPMVLRLLSFFALISIVAPDRLYAYVDPVSGSIVFQILAAGALGAAFTAKRWWGRVSGLFRSVRDRLGRR